VLRKTQRVRPGSGQGGWTRGRAEGGLVSSRSRDGWVGQTWSWKSQDEKKKDETKLFTKKLLVSWVEQWWTKSFVVIASEICKGKKLTSFRNSFSRKFSFFYFPPGGWKQWQVIRSSSPSSQREFHGKFKSKRDPGGRRHDKSKPDVWPYLCGRYWSTQYRSEYLLYLVWIWTREHHPEVSTLGSEGTHRHRAGRMDSMAGWGRPSFFRVARWLGWSDMKLEKSGRKEKDEIKLFANKLLVSWVEQWWTKSFGVIASGICKGRKLSSFRKQFRRKFSWLSFSLPRLFAMENQVYNFMLA